MLPQHNLAGLKPLRLSRNFSREHMASAIGVTATSYDRFENGTRRIYFDKAVTLAKTLGCTLDELTVDPATAAAPTVETVMIDDDTDTAAQLDGWSMEP